MGDNKENKKYWKITTVILAVLLIVILGMGFYNSQEVEVADVPLTREEIAEVERRTTEVISNKSQKEQLAELARVEEILNS